MSEVLVADIETDGLNPTRIWMVGILNVDTNEYRSYVGDDEVTEALIRLEQADIIAGHNFKGYDAPQIERLTEGLIRLPADKIIDTLELSRKLFPEMPRHGLAAWGEIFGFPKLDFKKFDKFYPEMVPYCERDVKLNKLVFEFIMTYIEREDIDV